MSLRYYDVKMNMTYTLEELRAQYMLDSSKSMESFEEWVNSMVEDEVLIPIE